MTENEISKLILDSAIAVHKELGHGLLESIYEVVLTHELQQRGLRVNRQVPIQIRYICPDSDKRTLVQTSSDSKRVLLNGSVRPLQYIQETST